MAVNDIDRFPPEPLISGAKSLVRNGLMQTDLDANSFRILNLDTSNLVLDELPSQVAPSHQWFRSYDHGTHTFGSSRPLFDDIGGQLTLSQQAAITRVGRIIIGEWHATPLENTRVPALNNLRAPTGSLDLAQNRIINLADPVADQDAVNKRFVHAILPGLQPKAAVVAASTTNMGLATLAHPVDGVTLQDNDRVLVKNQTGSNHYQNGIWLAHPGAWTRATDADTVADLVNAVCFVIGGNTQGTSTWLQITPSPFGINFGDPPPFAEFSLFSTAIIATAGDGLDQVGSTINVVGTANRISVASTVDIDINYAGQDSIGILGTIGQGTWEGDIIDGEFGGTGSNNLGKTILLAGNFATQISNQAGPDAYPTSFLVFSLMGPTSLTLPLLGTLATLNGDETLTNKHISATQIDSGVLLEAHGGTGANNAIDAINNLLPKQDGHDGEVLHTDGTNVYWAPAVPST